MFHRRIITRNLLLLALALIPCVLLQVSSESACAQVHKHPIKFSQEKKQSGGILSKIFNKRDKRDEEQKEAPKPTVPDSRDTPAKKIEETEDLSSFPDGSVELGAPSSDGDRQWSPEGRSFGQSVPDEGMLGVVDLIELALRNSEDVIQAEEEIGIAQLKRQAEKDWEDAQLRISVSRDNDVELQRPYETTERRVIDSSGRDVTNSVERNNINGSTKTETRTRNDRELTTEKITQKVTPRIDGTLVEETVESRGNQTRNESTQGSSRDRTGNTGAPDSTSGSEKTRSSSTERTRSFESNFRDPTHPDEGFRIRVRFPIPNFLERIQRLRQAKAEIGLARSDYEATRRKTVRDVRNSYEKIEYLLALDAFDRQHLKNAEEFLATLVELDEKNKDLLKRQPVVPGFKSNVSRIRPDQLGDARRDIFELGAQLDENQREINTEKLALAALAGIGDPDRIAFTNSLVEFDVDFSKVDIGYLKAMAMLKRPDLKDLRFRLEIAESETAEEKSKRIPMIEFFDLDYGQSYQFGERSKDEFGVQFGMSLPWASLFKNKAAAVRQREVDAYTRRIRVITDKIGNEVNLAVRSVQLARDHLLGTQENVAKAEAMMSTNSAAIEASSEDADRLPESRYDDLEVITNTKQEVVKALRDYNQAVRALETTIGTDLDSALDKQVQ